MHCSLVSNSSSLVTVYHTLLSTAIQYEYESIFSPHLLSSFSLLSFLLLFSYIDITYNTLSVSVHNGCFISCCNPSQYAVIHPRILPFHGLLYLYLVHPPWHHLNSLPGLPPNCLPGLATRKWTTLPTSFLSVQSFQMTARMSKVRVNLCL